MRRTNELEIEYLRRREREERLLAEDAACRVRSVHRIFADQYACRIRLLVRADADNHVDEQGVQPCAELEIPTK